jgi:hypothetical protein
MTTIDLGTIRFHHDPSVMDTAKAARYLKVKVANLRNMIPKGYDPEGLAMTVGDRRVVCIGSRHPNPDLAAMPGPFWRAANVESPTPAP